MVRLPRRLPVAAAIPVAFMVNALIAGTAAAHVKWFCAYNIAGQPRGLENVLCPDFEFLFGLSILALMCGCLCEGTIVGAFMMRAMDRATRFVRENTELIFRAGTGFFFIAIWAAGGILLTPELKTNSTLIAALQLGIAAGMLSRRTMPLSAVGIFILFAVGIWNYGIFHLADYPVFLGVALYLALMGLQRDFFGARPIDVVRWSAGITLMWASIEKWAYPEWSYPLLVEHPAMTLGFDPDFFMRAAGAIEFALAFALMWTPLVRRVGGDHAGGHVRERGAGIRQDRLDRTHADRGRALRHHRGQCPRGQARAIPVADPGGLRVRARAIPRELLPDACRLVRHVAHVSYLT